MTATTADERRASARDRERADAEYADGVGGREIDVYHCCPRAAADAILAGGFAAFPTHVGRRGTFFSDIPRTNYGEVTLRITIPERLFYVGNDRCVPGRRRDARPRPVSLQPRECLLTADEANAFPVEEVDA